MYDHIPSCVKAPYALGMPGHPPEDVKETLPLKGAEYTNPGKFERDHESTKYTRML